MNRLEEKISRPLRAGLRRWAKQALSRRGRDIVFVPPPLGGHPEARLEVDFDLVLSHFLLRRERSEPATFIQIGAGDGGLNDPVRPYLERGLLAGALVEPLPEAFAALLQRHGATARLRLHHAALAATSGLAPMFRVAASAPGPPWIHQLASFERGMVTKHASKVPGLEQHVVREMVTCLTFEEILVDLGVDHVDMLVVDTEGFDDTVLELFDIARRRPAIVHFEHIHLADAVRDRRLETLIDLGYRIAIQSTDTTAYLNSALHWWA